MATTGTLQADGTYCRAGASCRRHGTRTKKALLEANIDQLLESAPPAEATSPDWWDRHDQAGYDRTSQQLRTLGTAHTRPVTWHQTAARKGYVEVPTGQPNITLLARVEHTPPEGSPKPEHYVRVWLFQDQKPVAMLKASTYPTGFTFSEEYTTAGWEPESLANTIEVHPEHTRKGHGRNLLALTEKHIIGGAKLHSSGSYTPEGRAAYGNLLPLSSEARRNIASRTRVAEMLGRPAPNPIPDASFDSMRFVADWNTLNTDMPYQD